MIAKDESVLSEQEKHEADALIAMWKQACTHIKNYTQMTNDVSSDLFNGYGLASDTIKNTGGVWIRIAQVVERITGELSSFKKDVCEARAAHPTRLPSKVSAKLQRRVGTILTPLRKIAEQYPDAFPHITLLISLMAGDKSGEVKAICSYYADCAHKMENLLSHLRNVLKQTRKKISSEAEELQCIRNSAHQALAVWSAHSNARQAYLQECGIPLSGLVHQVLPPSAPSVSSSSTPCVTRKRKKKQVDKETTPASHEEVIVSTEELPWQIICITHEERELATYTFTAEEGGELFDHIIEKAFENRYAWSGDQMPTGHALDVLRRHLSTPINQRHCTGKSFQIGNNERYSVLKPHGKYRILVRINDEDRIVKLIAGHRTELYRAVRGFKG